MDVLLSEASHGWCRQQSIKSSKRESSENIIQKVWRREVGLEINSELKKMAELIPTKLKKKAGKCTVMQPEAVRKTNNTIQKAVLKTHVWKRQLDEGKEATARELSTTVNISMRCIQQIIRLNYLPHKIAEDILMVTLPNELRLVDLREIPML